MIRHSGVSEFAQEYDAFLLDIWGVIHDGEALYPGVLETLRNLRSLGKKILFLSNAPRRAAKVMKALARFGISEDLYDEVMSSGEAAFLKLSQERGKKYFYIGPEKDADLLSEAPLSQAPAHEADFAVATGFDEDDSTLSEKLPQIKEALASSLPLFCVNPDIVVVKQNGKRLLCAGVIAEHYAKQGGRVSYFGKPYPDVYEYSLALLGIAKEKIIAIGDGPETDIKGARRAGLASALVTGGILKAELEKNTLDNLCGKANVSPDRVLKAFTW